MKNKDQENQKRHIYYVSGILGAASELLIEEKLLALDGISAVEVSFEAGAVLIEYNTGARRPSINDLNKLFKEEGYTFSNRAKINEPKSEDPEPSEKLLSNPKNTNTFLSIVGILLILVVLYDINSRLNILNVPSLADLNNRKDFLIASMFGDGTQVIRMNVTGSGYEPNTFKVRVNKPVRWEITNQGVSGCTGSLASSGLFDDKITLSPGETTVKEFIPKQPGTYIFSCLMGMVQGTIEVVDKNGSTQGKVFPALSGADAAGGCCGS